MAQLRTYNVRVRLTNSVSIAQVDAASAKVAQMKVEEELLRTSQFGSVIRVDLVDAS